MVGTTGFEPAASPTPRVRATRLRHVPSKFFQYGRKISDVKAVSANLIIGARVGSPLSRRRLLPTGQAPREVVWLSGVEMDADLRESFPQAAE